MERIKQRAAFSIILASILFGLLRLPPQLEAAPTKQSDGNNLLPIYLRSRVITPQTVVNLSLSQEAISGGWHGLIQLADVPDAAQRNELAAAGVVLHGYIPQQTWLATLPSDLSQVYNLKYVRWIGPLLPQDRVDPALHAGQFGPWAVNSDQTVNLLVEIFPDVALEEAGTRIEALGGTVTNILPEFRRLHVTLSPAQLWALAGDDGLKWLTQAPPPMIVLNDGSRAVIRADVVQANPYNLEGSGVQAGLWDDGVVDQNHPDFNGRLTVVETGAPVMNHATHVAGILGGDGANSVNHGGNVAQWRGIAPGLEIFSFNWDSVREDHNIAINNYGIDLSQNSWALGGCSMVGQYDTFASDFDRIVTGLYGRRIPVVFAAGNLRQQCPGPYGTIHGGAQSAKNTITVGGIRSTDSSMMNSSSWGPVEDGRLKPEVVAAGETSSESGIRSTVSGGGYARYGGTSMAAPAVAGSIALVLEQYYSTCSGSGDAAGNPQPATVKALLIDSADDLVVPSTNYFNLGPDYSSGYGRVNDRRAVDLVSQHIEGVVSHGGADEFQLVVGDGESTLKVTLVWDDVAAEPNTDQALVNNLDLELISPDGSTVYGPWILSSRRNREGDPAERHTWAVGEVGVRDNMNVVEQVVVDAPIAGTWTARIVGTNVPSGPQNYSIVGEQLQDSSCLAAPTAVGLRQVDAEAVSGRVQSAHVLTLFALLGLSMAAIIAYYRRISHANKKDPP